MQCERCEVLHIHIENLREKVAMLEGTVSVLELKLESLATKEDVSGVADSVAVLVDFIHSSKGLYRVITGAGALSAAITAIVFGLRALLKGNI